MRTFLYLAVALFGCDGGTMLGAPGRDASAGEDASVDPDAGAVVAPDAGTTPADSGPAPPVRTQCEPTGEHRARCALVTDADFAAGELAGAHSLDGWLTLADEGRTAGSDTTGAYNGGAYEYGSFTSDVLEPGMTFDGIVPSWIAETPPGTWISVQVSARVGGAWSGWYRLGVWASSGTDVMRHSFEGERDGLGSVSTDTVLLDALADAARVRVTLFTADGGVSRPRVERLTLAFADRGRRGTDDGGEAWGTILDVPGRSQMIYPDGGEVWCSPTSVTMMLAYWAEQTGDESLVVPVPTAAAGTYDHVYGGNGNWSFNIAFAGTRGLVGEVAWLSSMSDVERYIARGIPVAISARWASGEIDGAAIDETNGHLLVIRGFTAEGDVAVNDPAAHADDAVHLVYDRAQLEGGWMRGSGGVVYLLWPRETL